MTYEITSTAPTNAEARPKVGPIKIGERKYMEDFFRNGTIYMNPLSYYREVENNTAVGDKDEGLFAFGQPEHCRLEITPHGYEGAPTIFSGADFASPIRMRMDFIKDTPVYCMFVPDQIKGKYFIIDSRMWEFGDTIVYISNGKEFLRRVLQSVQDHKIPWFESRGIEYVDKHSYTGEMGIFRKFKEYEYQREVRFAVLGSKGPLSFSIGSIEDIAIILDRNEYIRKLEDDANTPELKAIAQEYNLQ